MFQCNKCKEYKLKYDYTNKKYICSDCGYKEIIKPEKIRCSCGKVYDKYTWFDPSGCPKCNLSFIDWGGNQDDKFFERTQNR